LQDIGSERFEGEAQIFTFDTGGRTGGGTSDGRFRLRAGPRLCVAELDPAFCKSGGAVCVIRIREIARYP